MKQMSTRSIQKKPAPTSGESELSESFQIGVKETLGSSCQITELFRQGYREVEQKSVFELSVM